MPIQGGREHAIQYRGGHMSIQGGEGMQRRNLQRALEYFDANGDGWLTPEVCAPAACHKRGETHLGGVRTKG